MKKRFETRLEDETLLKFAQGEGKPKRGEDLKIIYLIQSTFKLWPQQKDELGWKVETNGDFPQFLLQRGADGTFLSSIQTTAPLKCVGFRYFFHSLNNCIESFFLFVFSIFVTGRRYHSPFANPLRQTQEWRWKP